MSSVVLLFKYFFRNTTKVLSSDDEDVSTDQNCEICLQPIYSFSSIGRPTECYCTFHKRCISEWLENGKDNGSIGCPTCGISISGLHGTNKKLKIDYPDVFSVNDTVSDTELIDYLSKSDDQSESDDLSKDQSSQIIQLTNDGPNKHIAIDGAEYPSLSDQSSSNQIESSIEPADQTKRPLNQISVLHDIPSNDIETPKMFWILISLKG